MPNVTTPGVDSIKENIDSMASHTHDDKSFKPYMMERFGAKTLTTKPSTAAQQNRLLKNKKQGYMSGGSLAAELGMNPTETSPRGSVKSSGFKKIYSKISHHRPENESHAMPKINQHQFNRKDARSQGAQGKRRPFNPKIRKAQSKKRNPFEYNPKPGEMKSDEGGVFGMPAGFYGSESYIQGVKAPSSTSISKAKMKQH